MVGHATKGKGLSSFQISSERGIESMNETLSKTSNSQEKPEIETHIEEVIFNALSDLLPKKHGVRYKVFKQLVKALTELYIDKKYIVSYVEFMSFRFGHARYINMFLDRLIRKGFIRARYIGPPKKFLPSPCNKVRGLPKDPWIYDRTKSGALKIWSFYSTGNKRLREKRYRCWKDYIELKLLILNNDKW
jgi:hypothetical protein